MVTEEIKKDHGWQQSLLRQYGAPEIDPTLQALKGQALQDLD
jgi:hypothetical protein